MQARSRGTTLILGASGFLGAHLVAAAVARARGDGSADDPLASGVVGACRTPAAAPRFSQPRDAARFEAVDLEDEAAARALFERVAPARIVNAAALARVGDCERDPARAERMNALVPERIARWCREHGARLVHVSTDLVFGGEDPPSDGFDERARVAPLSRYGETKAEGEARVLAACPDAVVARISLLYGDSGGRGLGASDALLVAVDRDELPPLFVDEHRTPLEVRNAARALIELGERPVRGLLHVAGPERVSRLELGLAVLEGMGLDPASARRSVRAVHAREVPSVGPRPRDVALDTRRARALLATRLLGVREGIEAALR